MDTEWNKKENRYVGVSSTKNNYQVEQNAFPYYSSSRFLYKYNFRQLQVFVNTMVVTEEQAVYAPVYKKICVAWPSTTLYLHCN